MKRLGILSSLFIFLSLSVKAQDTIHCPDSKYYWNNEECVPEFTLISQFEPTPYGFNALTDSAVISRNINKPVVLKRIVFPKESAVYGIAGTPTACGNPNGCYYYLCRKIGKEYIVIDSAEWTHNQEYNYIKYNKDSRINHSGPGHYKDCYPTFSNLTGAPVADTAGNIPIYEGYFSEPISMDDTFYIGMNPNCVPPRFGLNADTNCSWPITDSRRFSFSFYTLQTFFYQNLTAGVFTLLPFDSVYHGFCSNNINGETIGSHYFGVFYPIMEPAPYSCYPITKLKADSVSYNRAYTTWEQAVTSTYYQMEYGEVGFQHGTGVFIDSIMAQELWLNNLETNTKYEVYVRAYCDAEDSASVSPWRKVAFETFDTTCAAIANPTTVYVQDKLARISWEITDKEEVSNCEIEWGESGFARGSGNRVNNLQDTTYLFRNLSPNTSYEAFIRTYCPRSDVYSPWIKVSFTTETSGIMEAENSPIEVHPNPTTGIVEITLPQGYENKEVHIYNIHGTLLQTKQAQAAKLTFDFSTYSDGVYIIKIDNYSTRIVKTK